MGDLDRIADGGQSSLPKEGVAYLVGAGPGHPGLITVRGPRLLEQADVVLYDRLIARELLGHCRPDAELVFVGKRAGHHPKPQDEINRLLIDYVSAGKRVVRLKGGDVFIFSRGGEEVLALRKHGLRFEIVPGLTSSIAALAFAGIPVTQKGINTSFTVLTAHESPEKPETMIDWDKLAKQETLVLLMGVKKLGWICTNLVGAGMSADTPAGLISAGTTDGQQVVTGTLETLAKLVSEAKMPTPGIIVVGNVVGLHEKLKWHRPLGLAQGFAEENDLGRVGNRENGQFITNNGQWAIDSPKVALVGAGPGAEDLITVRGIELLRRADVVLHDRLVNPLLLEEVRPECVVINVGKSDKRDRYPQREINKLLVEHGLSGKRVVRLKGGDPFVFGLGGNECLGLREAGVAYEVVPGLSSVTAVPAHSGIPLTHRGINSSFTVVSGHLGAQGEFWDHLPDFGTLVILMGVRKLSLIVNHLLKKRKNCLNEKPSALGRFYNGSTPVAVIESGATSQQRVTVGTLETIVEKCEEVSIKSPALVVVGEVVGLRETFAWFAPKCEGNGEKVWGEAVF